MIRPRQDADLPALVQVLREVHVADQYPTVWPGDALGFVATAAPLAAWVAEIGGRPVGQILLCEPTLTDRWDEIEVAPWAGLTEIKRLFVAPALRGQGLAQRLMETALAEARRRNLRAVLQTHSGNGTARAFYERAGWQPAGTVLASWTDTDGRHPQMQRYTAPTTP